MRTRLAALISSLAAIWACTGTEPNAPESARSEVSGFFFTTEVEQESILLPAPTSAPADPPARVLHAACRNYADFLADRTLDTDVVILDQAGLLRSAELLSGEYRSNSVARGAETAFVDLGESAAARRRWSSRSLWLHR